MPSRSTEEVHEPLLEPARYGLLVNLEEPCDLAGSKDFGKILQIL